MAKKDQFDDRTMAAGAAADMGMPSGMDPVEPMSPAGGDMINPVDAPAAPRRARARKPAARKAKPMAKSMAKPKAKAGGTRRAGKARGKARAKAGGMAKKGAARAKKTKKAGKRKK